MNPSVKRQLAAQAVVNDYIFQELEWGTRDCAHLAASILDAFGHDHPLKDAASFKTAAQAARVLKKLGFETLAHAIDSVGLERIAPASTLVCDLIAIGAPDSVGGYALGLVVGPNAVMAFIEHEGRVFADTGTLSEICLNATLADCDVIAWRVA